MSQTDALQTAAAYNTYTTQQSDSHHNTKSQSASTAANMAIERRTASATHDVEIQ
jgi:hypothetical protein